MRPTPIPETVGNCWYFSMQACEGLDLTTVTRMEALKRMATPKGPIPVNVDTFEALGGGMRGGDTIGEGAGKPRPRSHIPMSL